MKLVKKPLVKAIGIVFGIVLLLAPSVYFYTQYRDARNLLQNPTEASKKEVKEVVDRLSKIMVIPTNEDPTVATVLDKEKLKDQPFFANAEKGDKVVIFSKAQLAILYRPSTNKIVQVAPINLGGTPAPTAAAGQNTSVTLALYNGTITTGLTAKVETDLLANVKGFSIVARENAKAQSYSKTLVVDVSGKRATEAKQLAEFLAGDVGPLPAGEVKPTGAEILIIVGKNYAAATPSASTIKP